MKLAIIACSISILLYSGCGHIDPANMQSTIDIQIEEYLHSARYCHNQNDADGAVTLLEKILAIDPYNKDAMRLLKTIDMEKDDLYHARGVMAD